MRPRIGRLRHRLTIERAERTGDGGGGAAVSWEEVAEVWGLVEATGGKEVVGADRVTGTAAVLIMIRHRADVVPAMRFRRGSEVFHILAVLDKDGRGRFLSCLCERRDQ
ncbi:MULTISPECIES: phage head closure protein [Rhodomicrobium]|uniref:phage head closure protein n=1 Tax=Rhodomicrobium TaxID=1068 RepID=UPI000B4B8BBB|nr:MULTISPECIES: phage head closure protein [Rhodomicrobium]